MTADRQATPSARVRIGAMVHRPSGAAALLLTLALLAVLRNAPGSYVPDNRFEQYWNPGRRIARSLELWDATRGLGRVREEFWPGATVPLGVLRLLGASPALTEHLWHATLLTAAGVGLVAVIRLYRPEIGLEHLVAGTLYMLGPYSVTFLIPSNLYFHYALTPWLVVLGHRGVHAAHPWRWAAGFALLVFAVGNMDTPGLVYGGVAIVLVLLHAVAVQRTASLGRLLAWGWRAAFLVVVVSGAAVVKTAIGVSAFDQRLTSTESPAIVGTASSWSESLRGLGFWVSYFRDSYGPVRPHGSVYFTNPVVVVATFLPILVGFAGVVLGRASRSRTLFAGLLVGGAFLMVGAFPPDDPPPWGRLWLWASDESDAFATIRSTYKAGSAYAIGAAALFGLGARTLAETAGRHRAWLRAAVLAGVATTMVCVAAPVWLGRLYDPTRRLDAVPDHWVAALDWLDEQPGETRVLFLPGTTRSVYRWGWPGDDFHDALLTRPHAADIAITLSTPAATDILEAVDDAVVDGRYVAGTLAPVLRRVGIEYVVLRNDLEWERLGVARPAQLSTLRDDPDLQLVAAFGDPGSGTFDVVDDETPVERALQPVEVFRVREDVSLVRAEPLRPWILLSGSGAGWFHLAEHGLLDDDRPIVATATLDAAGLTAALDDGAELVVTDTNRRRSQAVTVYDAERSRTLAAGEELDRPALDLYGVPGSQSVASYASATRIDDPGLFRDVTGFRTEYRAAHAFDGDLTTGWVVPSVPDPRTRSLRVDFREHHRIDSIEVTAFDPNIPTTSADPDSSFTGVARVGRAALEFSDGTIEYVNLISGRAAVSFEPHRTTSVELRILDVTRPGDVGLAEVSFGAADLDLLEYIRAPDDAFRLAEGSGALSRALAGARVSYLFARDRRVGGVDLETQLRREFRTVGARAFRLEADLRVDDHQAIGPGCTDVGLEVDGQPVPVRVAAAIGSTPPETVHVVACEPLTLAGEWHRLTGGDGARVDRVSIAAGRSIPARGDDAPVLVDVTSTSSERRFELSAPGGAILLSGDGFDDRWRASTGGRPLGAPLAVDGQNAWLLPPSDRPQHVELEFGPARAYRVALGVSLLGVVVCIGLVCARPRSGGR
jgi:arabinofuranan 3-O-arabinosyltransferase